MIELLLVLALLLSGVILLAHAARSRQKPPERLSILVAKANQWTQSSSAPDRNFLDTAAASGIYGLLLSTLGLEKGQNPDLVAFAERMIQENQAINVELRSLLQDKGISAASALNPDQRRMLQQLSQLSGPAFESRFLTVTLAEHQQMLQSFMEERRSGKDKDLQRFASAAVARLKTHLPLARKAEESLGASASR